MQLASRPSDSKPASEPTSHRRPGTGIGAKGQVRVEAILDAATEILIEAGYAQLSMRKIAARAGMYPGNLQYYFRSKQDVVRTLLERYLDRSLAMIQTRTAATTVGSQQWLDVAMGAILADQQSADDCRFFWELWALAARDAVVAHSVEAFYARYRDGVATALRAQNRKLGKAQAERRATLVVAMLEGLSVFRIGEATNSRMRPNVRKELLRFVRYMAKEID